jgi:type II secretory pathway component GspD/PulD (secretin)
MRRGILILVFAITCVAAHAADDPPAAILPCAPGDANSAHCQPSKKDLKDAKSAFNKGLHFQEEKKDDAAFEQFQAAARLDPANMDYITALEIERQHLVYQHLDRGNTEMLKNQEVGALADFRAALALDPHNDFAQQRLQDAVSDSAPKTNDTLHLEQDLGPLHVNPPKPAPHDFHFRGDSKALLTQVAAAYGVTVQFDDSVVSRHVWFDMQQADFFTAMRAACSVTKTFWTPLQASQVYVATDTADNHRQYDQMALRVFDAPVSLQPTELNEIVNSLRTLFEIKFLTQQASAGTIEVRAPEQILEAATRYLDNLADARPQVMLQIDVYDIGFLMMHNIGVHIPNTFTLYNIPVAALAALGGQSISSLINQLISSGGINQAGNQSISALLAQLMGQQNSIFSQPLATFGGGLTFSGVSLDHLTAELSLNESSIRHLQRAYLRTQQGNEASYKMGERYPILNASFAPLSNSNAINSVLQNHSYLTPFPSFNYEDLGLNIKAKPVVNSDRDIGLQLEMQVRSLGAQSVNGVPVISNREYKGSITLKDGEPAIVAGAVSHTDMMSIDGVPGISQIPGLNQAAGINTKSREDDELLIVVTPHVVNLPDQKPNLEIWVQK